MINPELGNKVIEKLLLETSPVTSYDVARVMSLAEEEALSICRELADAKPQWFKFELFPYGDAGTFKFNLAYRSSMESFLNDGGFITARSAAQEKERRDKFKEELDIQAKQASIAAANRSKWALRISIVSAIVALLSLLLKYI